LLLISCLIAWSRNNSGVAYFLTSLSFSSGMRALLLLRYCAVSSFKYVSTSSALERAVAAFSASSGVTPFQRKLGNNFFSAGLPLVFSGTCSFVLTASFGYFS